MTKHETHENTKHTKYVLFTSAFVMSWLRVFVVSLAAGDRCLRAGAANLEDAGCRQRDDPRHRPIPT